MKYLEQFPVTAMFMGFFLSSCVFAYCNTALKLVFLGVTLLFLLITALHIPSIRETLRTLLLYVLSACAAAGILSFIFFDVITATYEKQHGTSDIVTLQITECEYALSYASRYQAVIRQSKKLPSGTTLLLDTSLLALENGTMLTGEVSYTSLAEAGTDSFDSVQYYLPRKIMILAEDLSLEKSGSRTNFSLTELFREINAKLSSALLAHVRYEAGGLASAVLLGNKENLSESVLRDFRRIGISHLLVVSGTHFSVILSFAERTLRRLRVQRRWRAVLNIILIIFLMFLTGFTPSVIRAGIMHLLAQIGLLVSRKANQIHSFAISGTLIILANPYSAIDCSLQLSYIATYSCIFFSQNRSTLRHFLREHGMHPKNLISRALLSVIETMAMTSIITLNTLPLMWLYFGEISLISIPVNVIFIPLVTGLMYLTGIYLLLYPLRLFLYPMVLLLNGYCSIITTIAAYFSSKDWILLPVNYSFSVFFLVPLSILLILLPFSGKIVRKRVLLSACSICVLFHGVIGVWNYIDSKNVYFSYLPEKKNDGFVLKSEGKALLCEISDASFSYSYNLVNEVSELHCCEIETLLLTHYHSKHIQLLERLSQREILRNVVLPEPIDEREEEIYRSLLDTAELYNLPVTTVPNGGSYSFGDTEITLFERVYLSRSTHPVIAVKIVIPDQTIVVASCSFNESVPEIAGALEMADFPILGHHSPVYKKAIDLSFSNSSTVVLSEQAYEWLDEKTLGALVNSIVSLEPNSFRIKAAPDGTISIWQQ